MNKIVFAEFGNTNIKILFDSKVKISSDFSLFKDFIRKNFVKHIVCVFTSNHYKEKFNVFVQKKNILFNEISKDNIDISLKYDYSYNTLGIDRIISVEYLNHILKKDFILFNFGSALTINIVKNNIFYSGIIMPSKYGNYVTLFNTPSLKKFDKEFDDIIKDSDIDSLIFENTEKSLASGIRLMENSVIREYLYKYKEIQVVISGGDKHIPFKVFDNFYYDRDIVLKGLRLIYDKKINI